MLTTMTHMSTTQNRTFRVSLKALRTTSSEHDRISARVRMSNDAQWDDLISRPIVFLVGNRACTGRAAQMACTLTRQLAGREVTIMCDSGIGTSQAVMEAALQQETPIICCLPSGLDNIYPRVNAHICSQLINCGGAHLSLREDHEPPVRSAFLDLKTFMARTASILIVIEAVHRGSAAFAGLQARAYGASLGAVQWPTDSVMAAGSNRLLQEGAHVITTADDILGLLP